MLIALGLLNHSPLVLSQVSVVNVIFIRSRVKISIKKSFFYVLYHLTETSLNFSRMRSRQTPLHFSKIISSRSATQERLSGDFITTLGCADGSFGLGPICFSIVYPMGRTS